MTTTTYTLLSTLEARYGLSTTQLYKLLEGLHLRPKQTRAACYLSDQQVSHLENWIEESLYLYFPLRKLSQVLNDSETTYLYQCTNCGECLLSLSLHEDSLSLHHACLQDTGRYRLLAVGSHGQMSHLKQMVEHEKWDGPSQLKKAS